MHLVCQVLVNLDNQDLLEVGEISVHRALQDPLVNQDYQVLEDSQDRAGHWGQQVSLVHEARLVTLDYEVIQVFEDNQVCLEMLGHLDQVDLEVMLDQPVKVDHLDPQDLPERMDRLVLKDNLDNQD